MPRLLASVLSVNLVIGLLGLAWIFWRSRDPAVVDLAAIGTGASDPALVEALRAQAAGAATTWWVSVVAVTALAAGSWLFNAWRRQPGTPEQARSATLSWWLLLLAALIASFALAWFILGDDSVAQSWRLALIGAGAAAVPLAYYLSTALGVKIAMSPSVPLAILFRR
jgi:hypothetical protein